MVIKKVMVIFTGTTKKVAQRGWEVSILRASQKPSRHGPRQSASGGPAWSEGLDQITSRGPFWLQSFSDAWFCDNGSKENLISSGICKI